MSAGSTFCGAQAGPPRVAHRSANRTETRVTVRSQKPASNWWGKKLARKRYKRVPGYSKTYQLPTDSSDEAQK